MLSKHETLGLYCRCRRHPFMVSVPKPYVFGSETVCFWFGNRMFLVRKPYGFGTENVKGRQLGTDSIPFDHTLFMACLTNYRMKSKQFLILQNGLLLHRRSL